MRRSQYLIHLFDHAFQNSRSRIQSTVNAGRVLAARLCHCGTSAASAADFLGDRFDQIARMSALFDYVVSRHGHQVDLAALLGDEKDHAAAEFLLELVAQIAQAVHIDILRSALPWP